MFPKPRVFSSEDFNLRIHMHDVILKRNAISLAPRQAPLYQRLAGGLPEGRRGLFRVRQGEEHQVLGGALPAG